MSNTVTITTEAAEFVRELLEDPFTYVERVTTGDPDDAAQAMEEDRELYSNEVDLALRRAARR